VNLTCIFTLFFRIMLVLLEVLFDCAGMFVACANGLNYPVSS
jgi:hypothetical protein